MVFTKMEFKILILVFCAFQMHMFSNIGSVSAYPQPLHEDDTQQRITEANETEPVQFHIHQVQPNNGQDVCLESKRTGPCKASIPKYYFNQGTIKCERFLYGGCDGSNNRFDTFDDCQQNCSVHLKNNDVMTILNENDENPDITCEMGYQEGPSCKAYVTRWSFNSTQGKCVQVIYQGCGSTKNNFQRREQCEQTCGNYTKSAAVENLKREADVCQLPKNPGPCKGMSNRYYFNAQNNRCERFIYGGCEGNENRFSHASECRRTCGGDEPSHDSSCSEVECPWSRYTHYTAMGCKPIYDAGSCCPTRFDCPDSNLAMINPNEPKCRYEGKFYSVGQMVDEASSSKNCRASCICSNFGGKARIQCASIECPEQLGAVPPGKDACHRLYRKGGCCVYDYYCEDDAPARPGPGIPPPPPVQPYECNFEGKKYFAGERMYPKKAKCLTCLCDIGFNGNLTDEFCDKVDCGIEIYYSDQLERGCSPVYFQDSEGNDNCCPIGWQCPDEQPMSLPVLPRPIENTSSTQGLHGPIAILPIPKDNIPPTQGIHGPITILPISNGNTPQTQGGPVLIAILPVPNNNNEISNRLTASVCQLPAVTGRCKAIRPRFYFNPSSNKCEPFTYGGCDGNQNNFISLGDCERICEANNKPKVEGDDGSKVTLSRSGSVQIQPTMYTLTETDPCEQPLQRGTCRAYFPRFFFSPEDNACKFFVYGGCKGNENNFYSKTSCEAQCENRLPAQSLRFDSSTQQPSTSSTPTNDGSRVTFGDDNQVRQSANRFPIIDVTPVNVCNLQPNTGRCKAHLRRYHFDGTECKTFVYGGCGGNENNFKDLESCSLKCLSNELQEVNSHQRSPAAWRNSQVTLAGFNLEQTPISFGGTERCRLPAKVGSCYGRIPSYYYDIVSRSCQSFTFSGCFGNTNRFPVLEECKATCERPLQLEGAGEPSLTRSGQATQINRQDGETSQVVDGRPLLPGQVIVEPNLQRSQIVPQIPNSNLNEDVVDERVFCSLPMEKGPCRGRNLRYFWDSDTKTCLPFYFGGCVGNKNNFLTESDCLSICGSQPTIEQINEDGILSCSFGNETLSLGSTLGGSTSRLDRRLNAEAPCGVPICSCQTPPALTCIQRGCPPPPQIPNSNRNTESARLPPVCPVPDCRPHCKQAIRAEDGCPTCDCDPNKSDFEVEHVSTVQLPKGNVKG